MKEETTSTDAWLVDLQVLNDVTSQGGLQWGYAGEDLNITLLSWPEGHILESHINSEVDVVLVVIAGQGEVTVNEQLFSLVPGNALLIPKGAQRAVRSTAERFSYLSVHRRRPGLMPTLHGRPL